MVDIIIANWISNNNLNAIFYDQHLIPEKLALKTYILVTQKFAFIMLKKKKVFLTIGSYIISVDPLLR